MKRFLCLFLLAVACTPSEKPQSSADEAQKFIDDYTEKWLELLYVESKAEWKSNTEIIEGDTLNGYYTNKASEEIAAFTGSVENIEKAREILKNAEGLSDLQKKQLN